LDALAPFGYGHLLPRGLLREPVEGLARAHVVALSRSDAVDGPRREEIRQQVLELAPHCLWLELIHRPKRWVGADGQTLPLEALRGEPVAAFCGIGNPAGFRQTLGGLGIRPIGWQELPDHCSYDQRLLRRLAEWLTETRAEYALCTRKDLVKIPQSDLGGKPLWALEIGLEIVRGQTQLEQLLAEQARERL
jgi:tetraacyldisaccharide 4'-kinase